MSDERTYQALVDGDRIPRKHKLAWLGRKLSKKKLREKVAKWQSKSDDEKKNSYFCPNCGYGTGYIDDIGSRHGVEYPERWMNEHCLRCSTIIAYTDNSPWYPALLNTLNR